MSIYTYALATYGLTAIIALLMIGVIVAIEKLMDFMNIQDDE